MGYQKYSRRFGALTKENLKHHYDEDKETECWVWNRSRSQSGRGYGEKAQKGRKHIAHRLVWELYFGRIPEGMFVCHHCDNKPCINPEHLFLGTKSDNHLDALKKGKTTFGVYKRFPTHYNFQLQKKEAQE